MTTRGVDDFAHTQFIINHAMNEVALGSAGYQHLQPMALEQPFPVKILFHKSTL